MTIDTLTDLTMGVTLALLVLSFVAIVIAAMWGDR